MLKVIEEILKKHLDRGFDVWEQNEQIFYSPWDILVGGMPSYYERRALAKELTEVITSMDMSRFRQIPTTSEAIEFVKSVYLGDPPDEEIVQFNAEKLLYWLEYRPARSTIYDDRDALNPLQAIVYLWMRDANMEPTKQTEAYITGKLDAIMGREPLMMDDNLARIARRLVGKLW